MCSHDVSPGARPARRACWLAIGAALFAGCVGHTDRFDFGEQDAGTKPQATRAADAGARPADGVTPSTCAGASLQTSCTADNAEAICSEGLCRIVSCRAGWFDCDRRDDNGCEATLDSPAHCGACDAPCELPQVDQHACMPSEGGRVSCAIDKSCRATGSACLEGAAETGCKPGFGDCDGHPGNGCETALDSLLDCGACGASCEIEGAIAGCADGRCVPVGCPPGSAMCEGDGACRSLSADADNCGACGNVCDQATSCTGGRCTAVVCGSGTADCDGNPGNGCETDLRAPATCGACDGDCDTLPHVNSAGCDGSSCIDLVCDSGFGDCDGKPGNGCEQSLTTLAHCGGCGTPCTLPNGIASCATGRCVLTGCESGHDDCNTTVADGCEADLSKPETCGDCDTQCDGECVGGSCAACGTADDCSGGRACCDGTCVDLNYDCFPWPCPAGRGRPLENCGACGITCSIACCALE